MAQHKIFPVVQSTSGRYTATLVDENNDVVSSAVLTTATMTLYDTATLNIINSRSNQNILNANNVTFGTDGTVVWSFSALDMPKLHTDRTPEVHTALFKITWATGTKQLYHEVSFRIEKVRIVP